MAIDNTKLVIDSSYYSDRANTVRVERLIGQDDGNDHPAGTVVKSEDSVLAVANDGTKTGVRIEAMYNAANTRRSQVDSVAAAAALGGASPTVRQIIAYLEAKFPEDFA